MRWLLLCRRDTDSAFPLRSGTGRPDSTALGWRIRIRQEDTDGSLRIADLHALCGEDG